MTRRSEVWAELDRAYMDMVSASTGENKEVFEHAQGVLIDRLFQAVDYLISRDQYVVTKGQRQ